MILHQPFEVFLGQGPETLLIRPHHGGSADLLVELWINQYAEAFIWFLHVSSYFSGERDDANVVVRRIISTTCRWGTQRPAPHASSYGRAGLVLVLTMLDKAKPSISTPMICTSTPTTKYLQLLNQGHSSTPKT